jgi:hypothetical protein
LSYNRRYRLMKKLPSTKIAVFIINGVFKAEIKKP